MVRNSFEHTEWECVESYVMSAGHSIGMNDCA